MTGLCRKRSYSIVEITPVFSRFVFLAIPTSIEELVSHSLRTMTFVWRPGSIWAMEHISSSSLRCNTLLAFTAYLNITPTSGSEENSFCVLYYRRFMVLVLDFVSRHLEGTASAVPEFQSRSSLQVPNSWFVKRGTLWERFDTFFCQG